MSDIAESGHPTTALDVGHESYAFACMGCGHGWEQSYEIEHHVDGKGQQFVRYMADGRHVPSPLSRPTCLNCGGHVVRIMRAGQVSSVLDCMRRQRERGGGGAAGPAAVAEPAAAPAAEGAGGSEGRERQRRPQGHHWHLSDLLHPFAHRKGQ
ncbi:hypothetical protein AB0I16_18115 [Streptomyces sp. NPDC050703]|uniref:hypothetical protein n=1 Tax=Streptomyces sp. NPDC050703 TaxID=3157218 RepID=UPI0034357168